MRQPSLRANARLAAVACGLDASLGFIHTDTANRDSLGLDLIEPLRPAIEAWLLNWLLTEPLRRLDFLESSDGNCRIRSALCSKLSETAPTWAKLVAPWAEFVCTFSVWWSRITHALRTRNQNAIDADASPRGKGCFSRTSITPQSGAYLSWMRNSGSQTKRGVLEVCTEHKGGYDERCCPTGTFGFAATGSSEKINTNRHQASSCTLTLGSFSTPILADSRVFPAAHPSTTRDSVAFTNTIGASCVALLCDENSERVCAASAPLALIGRTGGHPTVRRIWFISGLRTIILMSLAVLQGRCSFTKRV